MERYGPAANRQCGELCPYVARVRVFAWQNGLAWDAALEELERRAARMCPGGTLPGCAQPAVCEQQGALPEECRVWRLLLSASGACGMSIYEYMKSAQAAALFDMPQASETPRPEEAAPQGGRTGEKSTPAERNGAGDGVPVAAVAVAEESGQAQPEKAAFRPPWKLPRPNMGWVHAAAEKVRAGWARAPSARGRPPCRRRRSWRSP